MPVQIDEVIISTTVNPQAAAGQAPAAPAGPEPLEAERLLADKILQIIRENSER